MPDHENGPDLTTLTTEEIVFGVEKLGWSWYAETIGLGFRWSRDHDGPKRLRSELKRRGAPFPTGATTTQQAQLRKEEAALAAEKYNAQLFTRPYGDWAKPDLKDLAAGGLLLTPDRTSSVEFTPEQWGSDHGPVNGIFITVELLTARKKEGLPPELEFALSNYFSRDDILHIDHLSARAGTWLKKQGPVWDRIAVVAHDLFDLLEGTGYDFGSRALPDWDDEGNLIETGP